MDGSNDVPSDGGNAWRGVQLSSSMPSRRSARRLPAASGLAGGVRN
jgi:hypothetical protein